MSKIQQTQQDQPTKAIIASRSPIPTKRTKYHTRHGPIFRISLHPQLTVVFAKGQALLFLRYEDFETGDRGGSEWNDHSLITWAMGCLGMSCDSHRSAMHWPLQTGILDSAKITACLRSATCKTFPTLMINIFKARLHNPLIYPSYACLGLIPLLDILAATPFMQRRCPGKYPRRCPSNGVRGTSSNALSGSLLTVNGTQQDKLLLRNVLTTIASKDEPLPGPDPGTPPGALEHEPAAGKAGIQKATAASISKGTAVRILHSRHNNVRPLFNSRYSCPIPVYSKWKRQITTRSIDMPESFWAITYLQVLASHNLESQPELKKIFDRELSHALEIMSREAQRNQNLASQVATAKTEVKAQALIISGLVRERSSIQFAAEETSVVSNLRYTIEHMRKNEAEMTRQIENLKAEHSSRNSQMTENLAYEQTASKKKPDQQHNPCGLFISIKEAEESSATSHNNSGHRYDQVYRTLNSDQSKDSFPSPPSSHNSVRLSSMKCISLPSPRDVPRSVSSPRTVDENKDEEPWKNLKCPGPQTRAVHKQLMAERNLNIALEEAVTELESQTAKLKSDNQLWAEKLHRLQLELDQTRDKLRPFSERQDISEQVASAPTVTKRAGIHQEHPAESAQRNLERKIDKFKKSRRKGRIFRCF